jgi:hypothetical protein
MSGSSLAASAVLFMLHWINRLHRNRFLHASRFNFTEYKVSGLTTLTAAVVAARLCALSIETATDEDRKGGDLCPEKEPSRKFINELCETENTTIDQLLLVPEQELNLELHLE